MQVTVERLRRWILLAASLLVIVLVAFLFFGRLTYRHLVKDLPGQLGVNIQQTANGFTYSQSSQGHTLFTIHASKLLQYKNGHALLHDASITLYGPPGSHRADRIYGADFDYEPSTGIASTKGQVEIEVQSPTAQGPSNSQSTIHVKTSALTFNSKTGEAETSKYTEFQTAKASGNSVGASYNSKTGVLILQQQVVIRTQTQSQQPVVIHATHLNFLRENDQASLLNPTMDYEQDKGAADQAVLYFRKDGSADHIEAQGHVRMTTATGTTVLSQTAHVLLNEKSQPQRVDLGGGVNYTSRAPDENMHGVANEATLMFAPQSVLKHAQFRDAVSFVDERTGVQGDPKALETRQLRGSTVDVDFVRGPGGTKSVAQKVLIQKDAVLTVHTIYTKAPEENTTIKGDQLLATLQNGNTLKQLDGYGHTLVVSLGKDGATNSSQSDVLHLTFAAQPEKPVKGHGGRAAAASGKQETPGPASQIEVAVEDGHVVMTQMPARKPGSAGQPEAVTAYAAHAEYHAADQIVKLQGNPRLNQGQTFELASDQIDFHRDSGDALATGHVKATYLQQSGNARSGMPAANSQAGPQLGGQGPTDVVADHAELLRAKNDALFYGDAKQDARMWQGGDSVWAPVIEIFKDQQELKAYGNGASAAPVVSADFTTAMGAAHQQSVVRVKSETLVYSDKMRQGNFHGNVVAVDPDGTMHAENLLLVLSPAPAKDKAGKAQQSQLERMIATGHVLIDQPGRKGEGAKLVYTASDGNFVLTGTPNALPYIVDRVHGKTTGVALLFNSQNDSVEVSGGKGSAVTDTRVPR